MPSLTFYSWSPGFLHSTVANTTPDLLHATGVSSSRVTVRIKWWKEKRKARPSTCNWEGLRCLDSEFFATAASEQAWAESCDKHGRKSSQVDRCVRLDRLRGLLQASCKKYLTQAVKHNTCTVWNCFCIYLFIRWVLSWDSTLLVLFWTYYNTHSLRQSHRVYEFRLQSSWKHSQITLIKSVHTV